MKVDVACCSNDALRAHGILPPKAPPEPTAEDIADAQPAYAELRKAALAVADDSDLAAMLSDSDLDSEDEKVLESYRAQRAKEMRQDAVRHRFGRIYPIQKPDYVREVNDASKEYSERNGTGVVCFLYKDGIQACELLKAHLQELAQQYSSTKFVSIIGNMCIENYPDRNLPTLILYRNGQVKKQIVGLPQGMQCTKKDIEAILKDQGIVDIEAKSLVNLDVKDYASRAGLRNPHDDDGWGRGDKRSIRSSTRVRDDSDSELDI